MQTLHKHIKKYLIILVLIGGWYTSQVIFSILYNPHAEHFLGIPNNKLTQGMVQSGYVQLAQESYDNNKPYPIEENSMSRYNTKCVYGQGRCQIFAFQYLVAAVKRLDTIQFIGKYVIASAPSDVSNRLIDVTRLSPYRSYPYIFGVIVGPTANKEYSDTTGKQLSRINTVKLGEIGIQHTCDSSKIEKIKTLTYSEFLQAVERKDPSVRSPCTDYRLAHMMGFNYFYYLDQPEESSFYYMVAALHDDVPTVSISMPAIVRGRAGDNLTSASIRYDRFQNANQEYKKPENTKDASQKKELEKTMDTSIKKAVGEISMYILSQTYPHGLGTGESINTNKVQSTIKTLLSDCKEKQIACELTNIGIQQGRISLQGKLIYPTNSKVKYERQDDTKTRQAILRTIP